MLRPIYTMIKKTEESIDTISSENQYIDNEIEDIKIQMKNLADKILQVQEHFISHLNSIFMSVIQLYHWISVQFRSVTE